VSWVARSPAAPRQGRRRNREEKGSIRGRPHLPPGPPGPGACVLVRRVENSGGIVGAGSERGGGEGWATSPCVTASDTGPLATMEA
jgi:hypothetical protein